MELKKSTISFFLVGCWNRGVVPEQQLVFDTIIKYQEQMNMLLILGDNVYSNKDSLTILPENQLSTAQNQHSLNVFHRGIESLLKSSQGQLLTKPVYMVLGNHDVSKKQKNCEIYHTQLNINSKYSNIFTKFPYYFEDLYSLDKTTSVRLICIDTNFVDLSTNYNSNSCISRNSDKTNQNLLKLQMTWLDNTLRTSNTDYILIMGHHPLVYNKMKKGLKKGTNDLILPLIELFGHFSHKNITYICADNHMYQDWTITYPNGNSIHQIICGTGGAILDEGENPDSSFVKNGIHFDRDREIAQANGFCQLLFDRNIKTTRFLEVYKHPNKSKGNKINS